MKTISNPKCDHSEFDQCDFTRGFGLRLLILLGLILMPGLNLKFSIESDSIETSVPSEECLDGYEKEALSEISNRSPKQRLLVTGRFVMHIQPVALVRFISPQPFPGFDGHRLPNGDCAPQRT
jgi:hypothetical protein